MEPDFNNPIKVVFCLYASLGNEYYIYDSEQKRWNAERWNNSADLGSFENAKEKIEWLKGNRAINGGLEVCYIHQINVNCAEPDCIGDFDPIISGPFELK